VPGQGGLAIAGLVLALVSAVAYGGGLGASVGTPGKSAAFGYAAYVVVAIVALVALVGRQVRGPLLPFVLGASFLSLAGLLFDVLSLPAYHPLSGGHHAEASFLGTTAGDVAGAIAAIILLIAVRRIHGRGGWARPRVIPALLLVASALAWVAWAGVWTAKIARNHSSAGNFLSEDYPFAVFVAAGLVAAVIAALCALDLRTRSAGGALLLGWTVTALLFFGQIITGGLTYHGAALAGNLVAALLMLATAVLAIVYAARKPANPVGPGSPAAHGWSVPPGR